MRHVIIIKLLLLFCAIPCCYGQASLNDSLLFYEYKYYKCDNDSVKQKILLKKIDLYLAAGNTNTDVFREIKRVNINYLSARQTDFLWNACIVSYLNNEDNYARFFLNEYNVATKDTSVAALLLKVLIYKYSDTSITHQAIRQLCLRDPVFCQLSCFDDIAGFNKKHLNFYLISSAILPGSGSALNGYVLKGVLSLALVSASAYAVVKMVEYGLYLNAVLWGTGVGLKFYVGNINLTEKLFYKAEAKHKSALTKSCEFHVKNILNNYPLTLKLK